MHDVSRTIQCRAALVVCLLMPLACFTAPAQTNAVQQQTNLGTSDTDVLAQVQRALNKEDAFKGLAIDPSVSSGVVTLTGVVPSASDKKLADFEIKQVEGVRRVVNNLQVKAPASEEAKAAIPSLSAASPQVPNSSKTFILPSGTSLLVRASQDMSSKTAKVGDPFQGNVAADIMQGSYVLIPAKSPVTGRVVEAKPATHFTGGAMLSVELVSLRVADADGRFEDRAIATDRISNSEAGRGTNTAAKGAAGAGIGALIGALAGGGAGAGIGAVSGAAVGAGSNGITKGKDIEIKAESLLKFTTENDLSLPVYLRDGQQTMLPVPVAPVLHTRQDVVQAATDRQ